MKYCLVEDTGGCGNATYNSLYDRSYWEVQAGGCSIPDRPSPASARNAAFLLKKEGLPAAAGRAMRLGVKSVVEAMARRPGYQPFYKQGYQ